MLIVDESQAGASGCSIDKSVHFMQLPGAGIQASTCSTVLTWLTAMGKNVLSVPRHAV
jgi:hypothetical protein